MLVIGDDAASPRPALPHRQTAPLRLLVETRAAGAAADLALREAVRAALGPDAAGHQWRVTRLFAPPPHGAGDPADPLARFFAVSGEVATPYPFSQVAFELAYRLRDAAPVANAQPDLPSAAYDPALREVRQSLRTLPEAEHRSAVGVAPMGGDLPASESRTWAIDAMRCPAAWALDPPPGGARFGQGIVVGHPDTGYHLHPAGVDDEALDLAHEYNFLDNTDDARDPLSRDPFGWLETPGHGTGTGAVLVSRARDAGGVRGTATRASLVPLRAIRSVVIVYAGDVARAVNHARHVGCHVVSMSLGGLPFAGLELAIRRAVDDGLLVMAAAGNYSPVVVFPAAYPTCIAVAASNADDGPWAFSSRGPAVLVSAPGESVWSATFDLSAHPPTPTTARHHGTSFAVAHLAGVAALWLAFHGRDALVARYGRGRLQEVFRHLVATVGRRQPPGWDTGQFGAGVVDAAALLGAPLPAPTEVAAEPAPAPTDPASALAALCPELPPDDLARRLGDLLRARGGDLDRLVDRYGLELFYLLSETESLRAAFVAPPPSADAARVLDAADLPATPARALLQVASPSLAAHLSRLGG